MTIQDIFDKYLDTQVEAEDSTNLYQCFDWAFKYCDEIGIPREAIRHLNAYQIWTEPNDETIKYFEFTPNTPNGVPQLGDIVVFSTLVGPSGHVCIATGEGDNNFFKSTDQNWNGVQKVVYINHRYDGVLGWLRNREIIAQSITQEFNDQTKIPKELLGEDQDLEIQQIRGYLLDGKRDNVDLVNCRKENEELKKELNTTHSAYDNLSKDYDKLKKQAQSLSNTPKTAPNSENDTTLPPNKLIEFPSFLIRFLNWLLDKFKKKVKFD